MWVFHLSDVVEGLVYWDGPGRRGPDGGVSADERGRSRRFDDLERYVDLGRDDVLVFDLGLGERRLLDRGPHDRLGAAVELPRHRELHQLGDDRGLALIFHGEIGVVPFAHHAEALEMLHLDRSEDPTSELQSLMRTQSAVFCLKK